MVPPPKRAHNGACINAGNARQLAQQYRDPEGQHSNRYRFYSVGIHCIVAAFLTVNGMPGFAADDSQEVTGQPASTSAYSRGSFAGTDSASHGSTVGETHTPTAQNGGFGGGWSAGPPGSGGSEGAGSKPSPGGSREAAPSNSGYRSELGGREDYPATSQLSSGNPYGYTDNYNRKWYDSASHGRLQSTADAAADFYGIPRPLFNALIYHESGWATNRKSPTGAFGPAQLMKDAAFDMGINRFDPAQNIWGGAAYLRSRYNQFGNWKDALNGYNAGPGNAKDPNPYAGDVSALIERGDQVFAYSGNAAALGKRLTQPTIAQNPAMPSEKGKGENAATRTKFGAGFVGGFVKSQPSPAPIPTGTIAIAAKSALGGLASPFFAIIPTAPIENAVKTVVSGISNKFGFTSPFDATLPGDIEALPVEPETKTEPPPNTIHIPGIGDVPIPHMPSITEILFGGGAPPVTEDTGSHSSVINPARKRKKKLPASPSHVASNIGDGSLTGGGGQDTLSGGGADDTLNVMGSHAPGDKPGSIPGFMASAAGSFFSGGITDLISNGFNFLSNLNDAATLFKVNPKGGIDFTGPDTDKLNKLIPIVPDVFQEGKQFLIDNLPFIGIIAVAGMFAFVGVKSLTSPGHSS